MIVVTILVLLALPFVVLRRRTLLRYFAVDGATWLLAWLVWRRAPAIDPYLAFVALAGAKLATFSFFVATGREVRWSANRAALVAAVVYTLLIPAMLRTVIDGDEPYYLLITESIVRDFDLDLANQYAAVETSAAGRHDLQPQAGDPVGAGGEVYSRHEPFLSLLMAPGYALGGLHGAIAVIALFGVLLVRSTVRWMEDEGLGDDAIRAVFPLFAFGPPVLFYAARIWPEVPGAYFFVEALRGVRQRRARRWLPALLGLVLLKLRFVLVAVGLGVALLVERRAALRTTRARAAAAAIAVIVVVPLLVLWFVTGDPTNVHTWEELLPAAPQNYVPGLFGLLADGMSGIAFQAPFYLLGLAALMRWRETPRGFRLGILASLLYLLYLVPRPEWFGGWAPPLRYVVFLMPVLALGAAFLWPRVPRAFGGVIGVWTAALVIHGAAHPWRLFHLANGENAMGEWLSLRYGGDFSRLFPSFVRVNDAAWIGAAIVVALVVWLGVRHVEPSKPEVLDGVAIALLALLFAAGFRYGLRPADHVEFEDAHVVRQGGEMHPKLWTMMRVAHRGGWVLQAGDSLSFRARAGTWRLEAITGLGATIELGGHAYVMAAADDYQTLLVTLPESGMVTLRCSSGAVNLDRMTHE
jgi:hypothetical protein